MKFFTNPNSYIAITIGEDKNRVYCLSYWFKDHKFIFDFYDGKYIDFLKNYYKAFPEDIKQKLLDYIKNPFFEIEFRKYCVSKGFDFSRIVLL